MTSQRSGTTILILDRNKPVARLEPVATEERSNDQRIAHLVRQGMVSAAKGSLDLQAFLTWKRPKLPDEVSAVQALLDERASSR